MKYSIKLLPAVHMDLRKAKKWYNQKKELLGEEFKKEVNREIDYIGKNPETLPT